MQITYICSKTVEVTKGSWEMLWKVIGHGLFMLASY